MKKKVLPYRISLPAAATGVSLLVIGAGGGYLLGTSTRPIDWSGTGTFLQGVAALLAAAVAAWGVNRWQQELRFKRNAELAEKVLVCVEALGDAIIRTREQPREFEIYDAVGDPRVLSNVSYQLRAAVLDQKDHAAELRSHVHRVGVLFGTSHRFYLEILLSLHDALRRALTSATWESAQLERSEFIDQVDVIEELRRLSSMLFEDIDGPENDKFGHELNTAFDQVRRQFRKDL